MLRVAVRGTRRVVLLDCGDLRRVTQGVLRRVSDLLVSHAHLDHFGDFPRLLRARMGPHGGRLRLWGPPPFLAQVRGALGAFSWNLLGDFPFQLEVNEVDREGRRRTHFTARTGGFAEAPPEWVPAPADTPTLLHAEGGIRLHATVLDHGLPCLAFALEESRHVEFDPVALRRLGLAPGPWLGELRRRLRDGETPTGRVPEAVTTPAGRVLTPDELAQVVRRIGLGKRVAYAVDLAASDANRQALSRIAQGADLLYLEAAFGEDEAARARTTRHLTAVQAGALARELGVRRLVPIHVSARHHQEIDQILAQAQRAFVGG
ncbi:MAG: MBL fold metallo-hydrolase [Myxococcota bacterium]|nr:MBL fold metallo-hydrolase [Myxococcota bacterium]